MKKLNTFTDDVLTLLSSPAVSTCIVVSVVVPSILVSLMLTSWLLSAPAIM